MPCGAGWKETEEEPGILQAYADDMDWRGTNEGSKLAGNATLWTDGPLKNDAGFGSSGFSAFQGGYRFETEAFLVMVEYSLWWTAGEYSRGFVRSRYVVSDDSKVFRCYNVKGHGYSVPCIMD